MPLMDATPPRFFRRVLCASTVVVMTAAGLGAAAPGLAFASAPGATKLKVASVKATSTPIASGTTVSTTVVVDNPGARKAPSKGLLYLVSDDDQVFNLGKLDVPAVAAGKSVEVTSKEAAPAFVPAGKYNVSVCLAPRPRGNCRASRATVTIEPAELVAAPAAVTLGPTVLGATSDPQVVTITNVGHARTGPLDVAMSGSDAFKVRASECAPRLEPSESCRVTLVFNPSAVGAATGALKVTGRRGVSASVPLTGTGTGTAALAITPATFDFDDTLVGDDSATKVFTVTNTGNLASGVPTVALGSGAADFEVTGNTCTAALAPSATCTVTVRFTPTAAGPATRQLTVSAAPGGSTSSALSGTGLAPASLSLDPTSAAFGSVVNGTTTTEQTFTLTNDGDVDSGVPSVTITGTDAGQFTIVDNRCTAALTGGDSCEVDVAFAPTTAGAKTAQLAASATPGGNATAALTGTGQTPADLTISDSSYNFGYSDTPAEKVFIITNDGDATTGVPTVDLTGNAAFTVTSNTCTAALAGGATCTVGVTYTGTGTTEQSGQLSVTATPGGTVTADLTGSPVAFTVAPTTYDFGDVLVGSTSTTHSFTLTNHRLTSVFVNGETVVGAFPIDASCLAQTIPAGGSCTFTADFAPTTPGPAAGYVEYIASGDTARVDLTGNGTTPAALSLNPSTLDFGAYAPGDNGTQVMTVTNTGTSATSSLSFSVTGTDAAEFYTDSTDCPATLAGGASCTVTVGFEPISLGDKTASFTVNGAPGGTASLVGLAAPAGVTLFPATHDYGPVAVGGTAYFTFRVVNTTNNGEAMNSASSAPPFPLELNQDFTCVLVISTIAPHRWCTMTISFRPQSVDSFQATLTAGGPGFNTSSQLLGTGVPARPAAVVASRPQPTSVALRHGEVVVRKE